MDSSRLEGVVLGPDVSRMHYKASAAGCDPPTVVGSHKLIVEFADEVRRIGLQSEVALGRFLCVRRVQKSVGVATRAIR